MTATKERINFIGRASIEAQVCDKKMNIHLHLGGISQKTLAESLRDSEWMRDVLRRFLSEMIEKHLDDIQSVSLHVELTPPRLSTRISPAPPPPETLAPVSVYSMY